MDEKLALFEEHPSRQGLKELIFDLQRLPAAEHDAVHLNKLGYCYLRLFSFTDDNKHLDMSVSKLKDAYNLSKNDWDLKPKVAMNMGDALYQRWERNKLEDDLKGCIMFRQLAVRHTPILDGSFSDRLMDLADALSAKHETRSLQADLEDAIHAQRLAMLALQDSSIPNDKSDGIDILASLLQDRFLKSNDWYALEESIIWRYKIASSPISRESNEFHQVARDLSVSLLDRYRLYQVHADLQNAISWAREAVSNLSATHDEYSNAVYQLGACLQKEWERNENLSILKEEIQWYNESLEGLESGDPRVNERRNLLGAALCQKADHDDTEPVRDIEAAAKHLFAVKTNSQPGSNEHLRSLNNLSNLYESAVNVECTLTPHAVLGTVETAELALSYRPESELALYNLCKGLTLQYEETSSRSALDRSVELGRRLCQISPSPRNLGVLAIALIHQFHATASIDLLDEATLLGLQSIREGYPVTIEGSKRLINLGNALSLRSEWKGGLEDARKDICDSIDYLTKAISIVRSRKGAIPQGYQLNLAMALIVRYDLLKTETDLMKAIELLQKCLESCEERECHLLSPIHSNLCSAFMKKFMLRRQGRDMLQGSVNSRNDVNAAIWHGKESLRLASDDDPKLHVRYNNLAVSLQLKVSTGLVEENGPEELCKAVEIFSKASDMVGSSSAAYPGYLNNLAQARIILAKQFGDPEDTEVQKAIDELSQALTLVQGKVHLRGGILLNLAQAWRIKYEQECEQSEDILRTAIRFSQEALETKSTSLPIRIIGGYHAGIWLLQVSQTSEDRERAAKTLREAAGLLPLLSPRDIDLHDRVRNLAEFNAMDITADAVAAIMDIENNTETRCKEALELFEAGRGVIVGTLLDCRADLKSLATAHPSLAKEYKELQEAYSQTERLAILGSKAVEVEGSGQATADLDPYHLRLSRIEESIQRVLAKIRSKTVFEDFPKTASAVEMFQSQPLDGYIVALNTSQIRSDAFIMHMGRVTSLYLPKLKHSELRKKDKLIREALEKQTGEKARREVVGLLCWLWEACGKTISDNILRNHEAGGSKSRVWWIAGGVLGRLPLHACGNYKKKSPMNYEYLEGMQDSVVSSYIPTFKSLQLARERADELDEVVVGTTKTLIVGVSKTGSDGEVELRSVEKEIEEIHSLLKYDGTSRLDVPLW
ncbi:hypothetical protein FNYG_12986 [Fusarium nygamai]|uniref:CHAT domain-containing protein n=1 Tax=Gibberella nygamai TaxID=42673 RepID=A0A2K0VUU2_GIBNY|nr:hypothetical protein FNYG_12986 [Fusarium nygamai]